MLSVQTAEQILSDSEKLIIGMKKYKRIMDNLYWTDVSTDKDFQWTFNDFFVMRSRKAQYYEGFYLFLEQKKDKGAALGEADCRLWQSFCFSFFAAVDWRKAAAGIKWYKYLKNSWYHILI